MMFLMGTALAWQSICFTGEEDTTYAGNPGVCEDGYAKARNRWVLENPGDYTQIRVPEHARVWDMAQSNSGLPGTLFEDWTLTTFVQPDELDLHHESIRPHLDQVAAKVTRTIRPSEMTQLPDMSYALWDWSAGNELCPVSDSLDVTSCHRFDKHMGGLNSNHFLPQTDGFYRWYHQLAMARAAQCKAADDVLGGLYADREDLKEYVLACEKSAMTLEAVGQHYLQDSWSSGHMWERWGSPELDDWLAISGGSQPEAIGRAMLVAMYAGTWHGVKGVNDDPSSPYQGAIQEVLPDSFTPQVWDDPMCAPAPTDKVVQYLESDGRSGDMVGDIFFPLAQSQPLYANQKSALLSCSINGMRQVYLATGKVHNLDVAAPSDVTAPWYDPARDPTQTNQCFSQRATNQSLALGAAMHYGEAPDQEAYEPLAMSLGFLLWTAADFKYGGEADVDVDGLGERFRNDAGRHMLYTTVLGAIEPEATYLAEGLKKPDWLPAETEELGVYDPTMLGMSPNGAFAVTPGEKPAHWVDPELPWDLDTTEGEALSLQFADAAAWERCDLMEVPDLNALRHLAWPVVPDEQDIAIRDLCKQLVDPFLRVGVDKDNHAKDKEPLCHFADGDTFIYTGDVEHDDVSREEGLERFCAGGLLDDGGFEQRSGWSVDYNADVTSGVNTLVPYAGSQMLDLYLTPNAGASFGKAWQFLEDDLDEGQWALSFHWRVWTSWYDCKSWGDPWAVARVDGTDIGEVEVAVFALDNTLWCGEGQLEPHPGGRYKNDWTEAILYFDGPVEDPVVSFIMGTGSGTDDHHLLIDNVRLEKVP